MRRAWLIVDVLIVLLFVGIGRGAHHHAMTFGGMVSTTWPFAAGLGVGWLLVALGRRNGSTVSSGVIVWLCTVALGMVLRVVSGQGTAFAFILVALGFLGALMLGLRLVFTWLHRRESVRS